MVPFRGPLGTINRGCPIPLKGGYGPIMVYMVHPGGPRSGVSMDLSSAPLFGFLFYARARAYTASLHPRIRDPKPPKEGVSCLPRGGGVPHIGGLRGGI